MASVSVNPVGPVSPTPQARFDALKEHFAEITDLAAWSHCLGLASLQNLPPIAQELASRILVICFDTEHWSFNSDKPTEVGLANYDSRDLVRVVRSGQLGDHGENLMKCGQYHFFRIAEHAHMERGNPNMQGPEGNMFGQTRFTTLDEIRDILQSCFVKPLTGVQGHNGCNHPIVVLGHVGKHDLENLKTKDIRLDLETLGTVIKYVDTQELIRNTGEWTHPHNRIGLRFLIERMGFNHTNGHTAANDAGRTAICAFQLALRFFVDSRPDCKRAIDQASKTMQEVANDLETHSRDTYQEIGGSRQYCTACGSHVHMVSDCTSTSMLCGYCQSAARADKMRTHIETHCQDKARSEGDARRKRLEQVKLQNARGGGRGGRGRGRGRGGRGQGGGGGFGRGN